MDYLYKKFEFNIVAAELLIENNLYDSSVHCSYYGCYQLFKYKIKTIDNVSYEALKQRIDSTNRSSSHSFMIDEIVIKVKELIKDNSEIRNFRRKINELKQLRLSSDYEDIQFDSVKSNKALAIAKEIVFITKKLQ